MILFDVTDELKNLCKEIVHQGWSEQEWAAHESDDWFQTKNFRGGFDEDAFGFGFLGDPNQQYWFELTLEEAAGIADGTVKRIKMYRKGESAQHD